MVENTVLDLGLRCVGGCRSRSRSRGGSQVENRSFRGGQVPLTLPSRTSVNDNAVGRKRVERRCQKGVMFSHLALPLRPRRQLQPRHTNNYNRFLLAREFYSSLARHNINQPRLAFLRDGLHKWLPMLLFVGRRKISVLTRRRSR